MIRQGNVFTSESSCSMEFSFFPILLTFLSTRGHLQRGNMSLYRNLFSLLSHPDFNPCVQRLNQQTSNHRVTSLSFRPLLPHKYYMVRICLKKKTLCVNYSSTFLSNLRGTSASGNYLLRSDDFFSD